MATEITMPRLSDTMFEGTVAKWRKQVGDQVAKGEIVVEIETDKATMELESFQSGILGRIVVPEGQTVPIGETIALLTAPGETLAAAEATPAPPTPTASAARAAAAAPATPAPSPIPATPEPEGRLKVSPLARRLAQEQQVDLRRVSGTGPGGRIVREDVEGFVQQRDVPSPAQTIAASAAFPGLDDAEEVMQLSSMQRTIVQRMLDSKAAAPHFYVTSEIDMAEAVALRKAINAALPEGQGVSFNDMVVKGVALALMAVPEVNSAYRDGKFVRFKSAHVGVAVAIPDGLVVPVIRHAQRKTLAQIAAEAKETIEKARTRKLALADMEGST
ncbi:MAG: dihydrolipoamide acetyltransferase family protein, partial [Chloroflexota bacterium]